MCFGNDHFNFSPLPWPSSSSLSLLFLLNIGSVVEFIAREKRKREPDGTFGSSETNTFMKCGTHIK